MSELEVIMKSDRVAFWSGDICYVFCSELQDYQVKQVAQALRSAYAEGQRAKALELRSALSIPPNFWSGQQ